jgi:predicted membrane-bound mannosyltransferase/sugar lactone lactonase YvrE
MLPQTKSPTWLDRPLLKFLPGLSIETFIALVILALAIFSRLYDVGARVMSHDEVNHVVPAYDLYQGRGYRYDPVTHGPLQFHMMALSFFVLGDSDTSARMPAVLFGTGIIAFVLFAYRRFLGRVGALVAGFLLLISPYLLFYSRYTRNEIYIAFWAAALLFAILAYVESGKTRYLFLFTLITALHFIDKATSYIFAAEIMLFLVCFFVERALHQTWKVQGYWRNFIYALMVLILFTAIALGMYATGKVPVAVSTTATPAVSPSLIGSFTPIAQIGIPIGLLGAMLGLAAAIYFLVKGLGWERIRDERAFDLLILQSTIVLPLSASIFIKLAGIDPLNYTNSGLVTTALFILPLLAVAIAIGLWWRPREWLLSMAIFWTIFIVFYSTFFTNGLGIPMGLVAALGYWMSQQTVQRGSQPLYFYLLVQVPTYEFLPALGTILAIYIGIRHRLWLAFPGLPFTRFDQAPPVGIEEQQGLEEGQPLVQGPAPTFAVEADGAAMPNPLAAWLDHVKEDRTEMAAEFPADTTGLTDDLGQPQTDQDYPQDDQDAEGEAVEEAEPMQLRPVPTLALLVFWSLSSLAAFSVAGERMPWLTVHIALPMILAAGWGLGYLIETAHWGDIRKNNGLVVTLLTAVFLISLSGGLVSLLGATPPFLGKTLEQLQATSIFLTSALVFLASGYALVRLLNKWQLADIRRVAAFIFFAFLAVLTIRTSIRAAYINYDTALEFLVYAHAARGPKDALAQIEEISYRTTGGKDIVVAYDNDVNYPYWWYLRDYTNKVYFGDKPTRELRNYPIVAVGEAAFSKVDPILGDAYYKFDYSRLWWPMQDYFDLNWDRIRNAITDPRMRSAVFQIWFNRNYKPYADLEKRDNLTLANWQPGNRMRLYIRKDIVAQMWKYGVAAAAQPAQADPYAKGKINLNPSLTVGVAGNSPGAFNAPRQVAFAPDGTMYVADSRNNRIQHLSADGGKVINQWGTFADVTKGSAPGGTFYEPWGIAVGPDGAVFVADTWNNRIQKFTAEGKFVTMWGYFGQAEKPDAFWGPRGLAFDSQGHLYVTDTGNKRVAVFDENGIAITQFGSGGADPGQFDEPVGIAIDKEGKVYVADTWNQRVQVLAPDSTGKIFTQVTSWNIEGWYGQSIENKPYIAMDNQGHVFVTDPEAFRVLEFKSNGDFMHTWGDYGADQNGIGQASGVAVDAAGNVWLSDSVNNHLLRFTSPAQ